MPPQEPITPPEEVKSKKKYNIKALKRDFSFSQMQLILFALVFGLVGGYAVYKTFAASPSPYTQSSYASQSAGSPKQPLKYAPDRL